MITVSNSSAEAHATEIYTMIAEKARMVGIQDVPAVFVLSASEVVGLSEISEDVIILPPPRDNHGHTPHGGSGSVYKDPRGHLCV